MGAYAQHSPAHRSLAEQAPWPLLAIRPPAAPALGVARYRARPIVPPSRDRSDAQPRDRPVSRPVALDRGSLRVPVATQRPLAAIGVLYRRQRHVADHRATSPAHPTRRATGRLGRSSADTGFLLDADDMAVPWWLLQTKARSSGRDPRRAEAVLRQSRLPVPVVRADSNRRDLSCSTPRVAG